MALIIRNPTGSNVVINDLGLELAPSETHDLAIETASDVQKSANGGDLQTRIIALQIQVLDPLDNTTVLTTTGGSNSPAIQCVRSHNDPHYRIKGGTLNQLDDVIYAGSPEPNNPNLNDIIQWNGSNWISGPILTGIGDVDRIQHIHVGKHGNDSNDGLTPDKAKLTFASALTATTGSPTLRYTVYCEDSGTYVESFTVPSNVSIEAVDATINGTITIGDDSEVTVREVTAIVNNSAIVKTTGSSSARINAEILRSTGTGDTVSTTSGETGVLLVYARQVFTENGGGIVDNSTAPAGHIHCEIEDLYITGSGSGLDRSTSTGLIVGRIAHIIDTSGGGSPSAVGIDITTGRVDVVIGYIDVPIAYRVTAAGTLKMLVTEIDSTSQRIQTSGAAIVDILESNVLRWQTITNADSPFTPRRIGFVSVDTTGGAITVNLPYPPSDGDNVSFQDGRNNFETNNLTVSGNGALINIGVGSPENVSSVVLNVDGSSGIFIYNAAIGAWTFSRIQEEVAFSPSNLIYVTKNGNDTTGDGSFSNPFLTIKRGIQEALVLAGGSPALPRTVKVLDGIYDEINPLVIQGTNSELVQIQGEQEFAVFVRPTVNTQPLFDLYSNTSTAGPSLNRMSIQGNATFKTNNQAAVKINGQGRFVIDKTNIASCGIGIDSGNPTGSPDTDTVNQEAVYTFATISDCNTAIDAKGNGIQTIQVGFLRRNDVGVNATENVRIEMGNYAIQGTDVGGSPLLGTGISTNDNAVIVATSGTITNLALGVELNDTTNTSLITTSFGNNIVDYNQVDATADVTIQGVLSRTKQLIADGSIVSLNYIDSDSGDFIVGNADATGDPGLEFRVRDLDGRVFIGDNAENYNAPTNTVGGSRTVNLIDTNGNIRIWRWQADPGLHPAFEWLKGVNTFAADDEGDMPITAISAGADTITVDVSGADYNDPLDPGFKGADRTTLAEREFYKGKEIRVNGTASNNADYVISGSPPAVYNSGPQTITFTVTSDITVSEGAVGEVVTGGGAGRPDGVSTYVDDPSAAIENGVGDVHWDMLLRETDSFVIRRRTGGAGKEHFRFFRDRAEMLFAPGYSGQAPEVLVIEGVTDGPNYNYLTIRNHAGGALGPEIEVIAGGSPQDAATDLHLIPQGTGTVTVPTGYEANIVDDSLITKFYVDGLLVDAPIVQARRTTTFALPLTWTDLDFDTTDIEENVAVVEHLNPGTPDDIEVKEDGLYEITYHLSADDEIQGRVRINDTTVIPGSTQTSGDPGDVNDVITPLHVKVYENLSANDILTVQVQAATTAETLQVDSMFHVRKVTGIKGEKGDTGSGSTITIQEDDVTVAASAETINFEGNGVIVVGENSPTNKATVTINQDFLHRHNGATTQTLTPTPVTLLFGSNIRSDSSYTYSAGEVTLEPGWYKVTFDISAEGTDGTRSTGQFFLEQDTVLVPGSFAYTYNRQTTPGENTASCTVLIDATGSPNSVIRVRGQQFAGANIVTMANACRLTIESIGST